jgi:acetyl-CoA carboxylase biotin carboxyl carrier protein
MDLDHLKQLLTLVQEHGVSELEIEQDGLRVKVRKDAMPPAPAGQMFHASAASTGAVAPLATAVPTAVAIPGSAAAAAGTTEEEDVELAVVKSPIVGTFYRSPEPGAAAFVEVGATVKKGQVLCIIEAMKLMNEIDSEYDGEVVNVYVENGQPVQYGERLFAIRTS